MRKLLVAILSVGLGLALACAAPTEESLIYEDISKMPFKAKQARLQWARMARYVGPISPVPKEGTLPIKDFVWTTEFSTGEEMIFVVAIVDLVKNTVVEVRWYFTPRPDTPYVPFAAMPFRSPINRVGLQFQWNIWPNRPEGLEPGAYKVEVLIDGQVVETLQFKVT